MSELAQFLRTSTEPTRRYTRHSEDRSEQAYPTDRAVLVSRDASLDDYPLDPTTATKYHAPLRLFAIPDEVCRRNL